MTNAFEDNIKNMLDKELIELVEKKYNDYYDEVVEFAKSEMKKRGLKRAAWYFRKNEQQFGPFAREEIVALVSSGEINSTDYIWKTGFDNWISAAKIKGLFSQLQSDKEQINNTPPPFKMTDAMSIEKSNSNKSNVLGIKIAAVLIFIESSIWIIISILQMIYAFYDTTGDYFLIIGWNIVMSIGGFAIGIGVWGLKKWGYTWGLGTALTGLMWYIFGMSAGAYLSILFIPLFIVISILIYTNREVFNCIGKNDLSI